MDDRLARLESQVGELARSLRDVEQRLLRLEDGLTIAPESVRAAAAPASPGDAPEAPEKVDFVAVLALVGRTLLGLAGAYLLRAFTSEGLLPQTAGVAAGLAYAFLWIVLADLAGGRGRAVSAAFHGASGALIAIPLIWETTVRFELLSPRAAAAALAILTALSLITARRRNLRSLAWIVSLGAGICALMLGGTAHAPVPFTAFLVFLGIATLWLVRDRPWRVLPWVTAALADLAVLLLTVEAPIAKGLASTGGVLSLQLALFALYAVSFVALAHLRRREIGILGAVQTAAVVVVGYGGAVRLTGSLAPPGAVGPTGAVASTAALLGAASCLFAVILYGIAFLVIDRERQRNVFFYSGLAFALVLGGSHLLLPRPAFVASLLAVLSAGLGSRFSRRVLSLQAALYALAASAASGLLRVAGYAWTASAAKSWPQLSPEALLALAAIAVCLAFPLRGNLAFWRRYAGLPTLILLALAIWAGGGTVIRTLTEGLGPLADPAILATVRTAVLAAAALALAVLPPPRGPEGTALPPPTEGAAREASRLVYPVLFLGAVKLLVEDFSAGRPETLFLSLAFYGGALILAPRLRRPASV